MPTTATITPTLGAAPVTLQAGNYSAIDDRRFWGAGVREGVLNGGSYQVIQRAAGANMTVDVASSVGSGAVVQGDSVTAQGNYFVPPTAANVNVDIAASDATNPRNDLVVLEVKDDQHDAGGLNLARVRVITGTANASAGANDAPGANGTPALPSSCLLLAVVRVTAAATTVTTAMINDRRPWAGGTSTFETSLPSPAVDGQVINFRADSTNGVNWELRYRNAFNGGSTSYPWEFIGGGSLSKFVSSGGSTTLTGSYGNAATTQCEIVLPAVKGDFVVAGEVNAITSAAGTYQAGCAVGTGATPTIRSITTSRAGSWENLFFTGLVTATNASETLRIRYSNSGGGTIDPESNLVVTPVRLGT